MPPFVRHDPEAEICSACGQACVHRDVIRPRGLNRAKLSDPDASTKVYGRGRGRPRIVDAARTKKWRVVTYLDSERFSKLLKLAGGRDMAEVLREIIEAHPSMKAEA